jgi:hypothetical protein
MPLAVLDPYLGVGADVGEPERFMDAYASCVGLGDAGIGCMKPLFL